MNHNAPIPGYEGYYTIDRDGHIANRKGKAIQPWVTKLGYMRVGLFRERKRTQYFLHRLVAAAHIPNPDNLPIINHIDGDKLNNSVGNLEWCTHKHNTEHAYKTGLCKPKELVHGTPSGYTNWKCRCMDCTAAWRVYFRPRHKQYRQAQALMR